jgi:hypothetical protein
MLDLEEGQAYDFAMASYNAHGEESELASEVIFNGARENSAGERSKDNGAEADEADRIHADAESTDDLMRRAADRQYLDANGADEHEIVNAALRHPENDSDDKPEFEDQRHTMARGMKKTKEFLSATLERHRYTIT